MIKMYQGVALCVFGACCLFISGCVSNTVNPHSTKLGVKATPFGMFNGKKVDLYTLTNSNGMSVKISNYGATVTAISVPDKHGVIDNITAGFDTLEGYFSPEYLKNSPYFGGIIGRYASVIKDASFKLNGERYNLDKNLAPHHLHGGSIGFDRQLWNAVPSNGSNYVALKLSLMSADGDESYPGNVFVEVEYKLNNNNELTIHYNAVTDKDTPLSLTNHTYFNLNGFASDILDHEVQLKSQHYLTPDDSGVANGLLTAVKGTLADFNDFQRIGDAFSELPMGFEHFYVFNSPEKDLKKIATVKEKTSGRTLEVLTTEPGTLLYTGRYTSNDLKREDGTQFGQFRALCIETSKYPNGPNISGSPRSILKAGEVYDETTVFRFSWQ